MQRFNCPLLVRMLINECLSVSNSSPRDRFVSMPPPKNKTIRSLRYEARTSNDITTNCSQRPERPQLPVQFPNSHRTTKAA